MDAMAMSVCRVKISAIRGALPPICRASTKAALADGTEAATIATTRSSPVTPASLATVTTTSGSTSKLQDARHHVRQSRTGEAADIEAGADHEQARCERRATHQFHIDGNGLGQGRCEEIQRQADGAGPDERIGDEGPQDLVRALARLPGEADEHVERQKVEQRHHGGDRHRDQRDAPLAEQAAGDREPDEGVPACRALKDRREARAVDPALAGERRPQRQRDGGDDENARYQRAADPRHRNVAQIRARQGVDDQRGKEDRVGGALEPRPLAIVDETRGAAEPARGDDQEGGDKAREDR